MREIGAPVGKILDIERWMPALMGRRLGFVLRAFS